MKIQSKLVSSFAIVGFILLTAKTCPPPPPICTNDSEGSYSSPYRIGSAPQVNLEYSRSQYPPEHVIPEIYGKLKDIHSNQSFPQLIWNTDSSYRSCYYLDQSNPQPIPGSLYNPANKTIYITNQDIQKAYESAGDTALAFTIAHEYAHHMQGQLNGGVAPNYGQDPNVTKQVELQADCLAAVYLGKIPLQFSYEDVNEMEDHAFQIGDNQLLDSGHHGTPEERWQAVQQGERFFTIWWHSGQNWQNDPEQVCYSYYPVQTAQSQQPAIPTPFNPYAIPDTE